MSDDYLTGTTAPTLTLDVCGGDPVVLTPNGGPLEIRDPGGSYVVARAADPVSGNDLVTIQWADENFLPSGVVLSTISETVTIDRPAIGLYLCIEPTGCLVIEAGACLVIL